MMTETPDLEIEIGIMDALMKDIFMGMDHDIIKVIAEATMEEHDALSPEERRKAWETG